MELEGIDPEYLKLIEFIEWERKRREEQRWKAELAMLLSMIIPWWISILLLLLLGVR